MSFKVDNVTSLLENSLSVFNKRQNVLSSNIANVDTPNYRARDIDFRAELEKVHQSLLKNQNIGLHSNNIEVFEVGGPKMRNDGNNVNIDREMGETAKNSLLLQFSTRMLQKRYSIIKTNIRGVSG